MELALFLANALESPHATGVQMVDAAYELRRLHEENEWLKSRLNAIRRILDEELWLREGVDKR